MLKKCSTRYRNLDTSEFYFVSKDAMEFVQLSIELETPKYTENYLSQLKRSVAGLYTRCDKNKLYSLNRSEEDIQVYQIPRHIKTLKSVNEWIYQEHTPEITTQLAEIGCDDRRIAINSSHICADGGYLVSLINGLQTNEGLPSHPPIPGSIVEILKDELDQVRNKRDIKISGYDKVTSLHNLKVDKTVSESMKAHFITHNEDVHNLACYNKKQSKMNGLTEHMWCGLSLAFCALNNKLGPIGVSTCVDFRRFIHPQTRISNSMTNFFGVINVVANQINNKTIRISDISHQLRQNFNYIINNNALFFNYLYPLQLSNKNMPIAHSSNIGPIKFRSPIKDFELTLRLNQKAQQQSVQIMSYSKLKIDKNSQKVISNNIHFQFTYSPAIVDEKIGRKIFGSFLYFMRNIKPSMYLNDAYQEMKRIQYTL